MEKLNPLLFEYTIWRNGSPLDIFGIQLREYNIKAIKNIAKQYVIGYCEGYSLLVRPKLYHKAVMFFKDNQYYWFHLTDKEFNEIFG